ncbi:hypothetical protein HDV05_008235, partial [Chytridiales sp. JEL 0842]
QSDLRKTSVKHFLDNLSQSLANNDNWVQAPNVEFYPVAKKWKPSRSTAFGFVLRRMLAHINSIPFDPALPEHLSPMMDMEKQKIIKTIEEVYAAGRLVGAQMGMKLEPISHSGLGMLSLDRVNSDLAVNARGQLIEVVCIGWQRLKNKLGAEDLVALIQGFRRIDFGEAVGALNGLITGTHYKPTKKVLQSTKDKVWAAAKTKWENQHIDRRRAYKLNHNPKLDVSKVKDTRIWTLDDVKEYLNCLGYINPITGNVIDPDDFVFDRITDDSDYVVSRILVMPIRLNDAKCAGTSTNEFSTKGELESLKEGRGWKGVDDRIVV